MYLIAISTSEEAGTWPIVPQRLTAFVLALGAGIVTRQRPFAGGSATRWSLLAGVFGASGVAAVVYGGQRGPIAPVVVPGSMYPAVAIGLAWMFLGQALTRRQMIGVVGRTRRCCAHCVGLSLIGLRLTAKLLACTSVLAASAALRSPAWP